MFVIFRARKSRQVNERTNFISNLNVNTSVEEESDLKILYINRLAKDSRESQGKIRSQKKFVWC